MIITWQAMDNGCSLSPGERVRVRGKPTSEATPATSDMATEFFTALKRKSADDRPRFFVEIVLIDLQLIGRRGGAAGFGLGTEGIVIVIELEAELGFVAGRGDGDITFPAVPDHR